MRIDLDHGLTAQERARRRVCGCKFTHDAPVTGIK
jgi:hypothetical protein